MAKTIAMLLVIALVPIVHDHVRYEPGEELEIKETEAPQLLEVNAIKLKEEAAPADTKATDEGGTDALAAAQAQAAADARTVDEAKAAAKAAATAPAKKR